jgi:hypothetical protein
MRGHNYWATNHGRQICLILKPPTRTTEIFRLRAMKRNSVNLARHNSIEGDQE